MTMTNASPATGFEVAAPSGFGTKGLWKVLVAVTHAIQSSRMQRVLQELSDRQLEDIGLQRSDIREYAQWLVTGKGVNRWEGSAASASLHYTRV